MYIYTYIQTVLISFALCHQKKAPICPKAISLEGPEEAVALCGWRLHRALEPWEIAEPPPRVEEEGDERPKGRGKGKAKGLRMELLMILW